MLNPETPHAIDDSPANTLEYWLRRADNKQRRACEYYCTYKGCGLVIHPHRACLVKFEGREILVYDQDGRHKGRGWFDRYLVDVDAAITNILAGGGQTVERSWGDLMRDEIALRKTGTRIAVEDRTEWFQWLEDDELPLLLGTWMFSAGILSGRREITKNPTLGFHPTPDEWEYASRTFTTRAHQATLTRLAIARGAPMGLHRGKLPQKNVA